MINISAEDYYQELSELKQATGITIKEKYVRLRFILERICKNRTTGIQFSNLFSRLDYLCDLLHINHSQRKALQMVRIRANKIANHELEADAETFEIDLKALYQSVDLILNSDPSGEAPKHKKVISLSNTDSEDVKRMRVIYSHAENDFIFVIRDNDPEMNLVKVKLTDSGTSDFCFFETIDNIHDRAQLNLLNVRKDHSDQFFHADMMIVEPDFLMDISAIAECFRDYGHHPLNYFQSRLLRDENTRHLLLGNIANLFLDEFVNQKEDEIITYLATMQKAFRENPINFATCQDLENPKIAHEFFQECSKQFEQIRYITSDVFPLHQIEKSKVLLEPSFICESLGLQGRLDLLTDDYSSFIELKSGKAKELYPSDKVTHKENHFVQMMLYYAVLQFNLGIESKGIRSFLLYSKYPLLYPMAPYWKLVKQALNLRNQIVALEYQIQNKNQFDYTKLILASINSDVLNQTKQQSVLWSRYQKPGIDSFAENLRSLTATESDYFHSLYTFITKEQYSAKAGNSDYDSSRGISMLWNAAINDKIEAGEILIDLNITENRLTEEMQIIVLSVPATEAVIIPNFREGDAVILYQRNQSQDNATNKQIFKGVLESISNESLSIRLRSRQRNDKVLSGDMLYAIERDYPDMSFTSMFKGLSYFIHARQERRDLLLSQRMPKLNQESTVEEIADDFTRIVEKADNASDYFLLVGPPGTGKTSQALRMMIERFYAKPDYNILLLAYTNKAVDEICRSLVSSSHQISFMRIGNDSSCEAEFRPFLMKNVISECKTRNEVKSVIEKQRVFVATVSSMQQRIELFKLKRFDVAIFDEASQILEPQILSLLSATTPSGVNAIGKFILIGDYKQLPAVVVQSDNDADVKSELLRNIGLTSHKQSLFERLYRYELNQNRDSFCDILSKQGRMHPDISAFASHHFYNGKLEVVPVAHQKEVLNTSSVYDSLRDYLASKRMLFLSVKKKSTISSYKVNEDEAAAVGKVIKSLISIYKQKGESLDIPMQIGIITPYRSQIAMIRKELTNRSIPGAGDVLIDTVERYQGAQKDIIIYSCCVNQPFQLNFLSNSFMENENLIDRKLNVALTRARNLMVIIGNPLILANDPLYHKLINHIRELQGFVSFDLMNEK